MGSDLEDYFRAANDPLIWNPLLSREIEIVVEQSFVKNTIENDRYDVHSLYGIAQSVEDLSLRYRVHWCGFDRASDSWEPIESFDKDMSETLCRFHYRVYNHCHYCISNNSATNIEAIYFAEMMDVMEEDDGQVGMNNQPRMLTRAEITLNVQTQTSDNIAKVDVGTQTSTNLIMIDCSVQTDSKSFMPTRKTRKDARCFDMNFECANCGARFTNNSHLTRHLNSMHAPSSSRVPCLKCRKTFKHQQSLTSHHKLNRCKGNSKKNVTKKNGLMKTTKCPSMKTKPAKPRMKK